MTNPSPITAMFDAAIAQVGESLETIRHNFYVMTKMAEAGDNTVAGIMINQSGRTEFSALGETKDEKSARDMRLLLLLNDIQQMELQLEAKYGENFAEQLAAEHLDEDTYNSIMAIEDQDERRRAIAKALKEGIDNGTIDPSALDDPQLKYWVDARSKEEQHYATQASIVADAPPAPTDDNGIDKELIVSESNSEASAFNKIF